MSESTSILNAKPAIAAPLDPGYIPAVLANRAYLKKVAEVGGETVVIGIEGESGRIARYETSVLPQGPYDADTLRYMERFVKFLLWSCGGWKIHFGGPAYIGEQLREHYSETGARAFDVDLMKRVYGNDVEISIVAPEDVPAEKGIPSSIGGHLEGCRIGFDLGASDYKISAVKDGEAVFADEIPWNPKDEIDPAYHYDAIQKGLKIAAGHLPKVDAIGGSSAGVYIDNEPKVASLYRSIPRDIFENKIKPLFKTIGQEWGVPLVIINDGDVTALAGALALQTTGILGIAMGSSEAVGYLNREGRITGWLNELAFAPVDFNPEAAADEWSGDLGVGAMYFSQQAVNKLAPAVGIEFPDDMDLPIRLKEVQKLVAEGHEGALKIFETIGVYLGYSIPHYANFYDYSTLLILGRVTSGKGGDIILEKARQVLDQEFPELADKISLNVPDEKTRRVGQSVAAASLPELAD